MANIEIVEPKGKLGVMTVGLGAVATTMIAGVEAVRRKLALPIGSMTQMGTIRLGKRTDKRVPKIKDFVPLASLDDLVFGSWDLFTDNAYEAALKAGVLDNRLVEQLKDFLEKIQPMPAAFEQTWVKRLHPNNLKTGKTKMDLAEQIMEDIRQFKKRTGADRLIIIWCASTELFTQPHPVHETLEAFEEGLRNSAPDIPPSMIYAYAALKLGVPYANGAPHLTVDIPALTDLAIQKHIPICGKDFKSGQTFMKTLLAPGLKLKLLGLSGWFSTNILGNRDGEVLDDPENFKSKEETKSSVLERCIQPDIYPELYGNYFHKVRIEYYPPRGDAKESWDNLDIFGWLGYPMQIKVNFQCRDSILAAPMALDLVLFLDLAQRCPELAKMGVQEWLSLYFKGPQVAAGLYPEHDVFIQVMKLKNTLRYLRGEDLITHLGLEYYD
ncbi:MAG TPA: inositol-3-phosphate synthase [Bryobacteraceae bacterium]|nr:inositol-3-phosphate synthase [Bryobacteraceae bacterium]